MAKAPTSTIIPDDDTMPPDTTEVEAVANSQKLGPSATGAPIGMPKTIRIILEENENCGPNGQPVSLNGKAYMIRPGEPVDVPPGILEILDNATMSVPIKDPQTMKVVGYRNRQRFPYRRVAASE